MGPKKQSKKVKSPPVELSEFDAMETSTLLQVTQALHLRLEKAQMDRNYLQHERDTTESLYQLAKKASRQNEIQLLEKDREIQVMESNHHVQMRVYAQKVRHLSSEHQGALKKLHNDTSSHLIDQAEVSAFQKKSFRKVNFSTEEELHERSLHQQEEIEVLKQTQAKNLFKLSEQFALWNRSISSQCKSQLAKLLEMLLLRRKVDVHEIEERKNLHINDLMRNHEKAYLTIRSYYNDITRDNMALIASLKREILSIKTKADDNAMLMKDVAIENKRLSEPLAIAIREVECLRGELRDEQKDQLSLVHALSRLTQVKKRTFYVEKCQNEKKNEFLKMQKERCELYSAFEGLVESVYDNGERKSNALATRMRILKGQNQNQNQSQSLTHTQMRPQKQSQDQMQNQMDGPTQSQNQMGSLNGATARVGLALRSEKDAISRRRRILAMQRKAYGDSVRICAQKLSHLGIQFELEDSTLESD
uniref:Sporangia Induced Dynein Regulatory Complex Protein putative n=1 Tax=Albugo laibachii Nc14 TaxID=890382 RepID=F0WK96_9STRA|nr:Sporangia Induced Dynein Regulatory Complex Protein putative [Albugo laibachii Nc14]|eukprot:CCA21699.1 Sporangia Induced Dynein Regulatory Complex Protein putative [Albugo laibachii Nc14]